MIIALDNLQLGNILSLVLIFFSTMARALFNIYITIISFKTKINPDEIVQMHFLRKINRCENLSLSIYRFQILRFR